MHPGQSLLFELNLLLMLTGYCGVTLWQRRITGLHVETEISHKWPLVVVGPYFWYLPATHVSFGKDEKFQTSGEKILLQTLPLGTYGYQVSQEVTLVGDEVVQGLFGVV